MKKQLFFLLLAFLLALALTASAAVSLPEGLTIIEDTAFEGDARLAGRIVLPSSVKTVGARAFADTSLHALVLPANCEQVDSSVLAGTGAAYLYLQGADTTIRATPADVAFVFAPAFGSASSLDNFYASETLFIQDGFYYSVSDGIAIPLCAVDSNITGEIKLPKLVGDQPVRSLNTLILNGCDGMTQLQVPAYLAVPSHIDATPYTTMTADPPTPSAASGNVGDTITWTTSISGAYGEVSYLWTFTTGTATENRITSEPTVHYTLKTAGSCSVTVTATDAVSDTSAATAEAFIVSDSAPVYRALLVGNTYTGTADELYGPANDVAGMRTMLTKMTATPYRITTKSELTADGLVGAIRTAFAGTTVNDVSLFYFSGHGTNAAGTSYHGALLGTDGTYITVARLKSILDEIPGKKIVIVDSCHSGQLIGKSGGGAESVTKAELDAFNSKVVSAFATSVSARGENDLANSSYYVITAAHSTEDALTMGHDTNQDGKIDKYFGLFTYSLCYGSGWNLAVNEVHALNADADDNSMITLYEAYAYARSKALQSNPHQTAQIYPDNSSMVIWGQE